MTDQPMTNHRLADIQQAFQDRLLTGDDRVLDMLSQGGPFMKVYDRAYLGRLKEILAEDFEALHTLAGDDAFGQILDGYLQAYPSRYKSVRWLGQALPQWLTETAPWRDITQLRDMAAFEWTMGLTFDAPDRPVLGLEGLGSIAPEDWPQLSFRAHPSLHLLDLTWSVAAFKQAVAEERDPEAAPEPFEGTVTFAFWRHPESLIVHYRPLEGDEAAALKTLKAGRNFQDLCEEIARHGEEETAAVRAAGLLRAWIEAGWLSAATLPGMSLG